MDPVTAAARLDALLRRHFPQPGDDTQTLDIIFPTWGPPSSLPAWRSRFDETFAWFARAGRDGWPPTPSGFAQWLPAVAAAASDLERSASDAPASRLVGAFMAERWAGEARVEVEEDPAFVDGRGAPFVVRHLVIPLRTYEEAWLGPLLGSADVTAGPPAEDDPRVEFDSEALSVTVSTVNGGRPLRCPARPLFEVLRLLHDQYRRGAVKQEALAKQVPGLGPRLDRYLKRREVADASKWVHLLIESVPGSGCRWIGPIDPRRVRAGRS